MAEAAPPRRRRWPRILGVIAVLVVVAGIVVDRQLEPTRLATTVLSRLGPTLGLELTFDGEPEYSLRPEPRLVLPGFKARQPGAAVPLLTAERAEVSLPWDTITGGDALVITRVELAKPVLNLAALAAWQATRPDTPFELPTLTKGLEVDGGTVLGDGWELSALDVALPELRSGGKLDADLSGRFTRGTTSADFTAVLAMASAGRVSPIELHLELPESSGSLNRLPLAMDVTGDLDASGDIVRLSGGRIDADGQVSVDGEKVPWRLVSRIDARSGGGTTTATLVDSVFDSRPPLPDLAFAGRVELADTLRVGLGGAIPRWPEGWPTLPPPLSRSRPMAFSLSYDGATDISDPLRLRLARDATRLDTRLVLPELLAWMDRDGASPLPPLDGTLDTPELVVGAFTLQGVHVEFDDDGAAADGPFATVRSDVGSSEDDDTP